MTGGVKGQRARTLQMKPGAVGVCRSLVWPPTSHPYCPERTQRLLSDSGGQRFGQTRQTAAAQGLNQAEAAAADQSGGRDRGSGLSSRTAEMCKEAFSHWFLWDEGTRLNTFTQVQFDILLLHQKIKQCVKYFSSFTLKYWLHINASNYNPIKWQ